MPTKLRFSSSSYFFAFVFAILFFDQVMATNLPSNFSDTQVVSGLTNPTAFAIAPDGRIFVCEQGGTLRVIKDGALLTDPFLSVAVNSSGERGLLGVTFDPNFTNNRFVYIYYTATSPTIHNRVSRFTADGDVAVSNSEVPILDLNDLSSATNHNGGALHFGPDNKLYIAVGENANGDNSQTLNNLLGKMLRINSDGTIPADNPFVSTATGVNQAIWAMGLRNPYTFAFQPGGTRMLINDVGQSSWEEIDDGIAGSNYGWPFAEGATLCSTYRCPLFAYGHGAGNSSGCAITGGDFYNPTIVQFPADYVGKYFFADYCNRWIRRFDPSTNGVTDFATATVNSVVDLRVGSDGSLYYLARGISASSGVVQRIQYTSDADGDGVNDAQDNCPAVSNPGQQDQDGDGKGDACDACPNDGTSLFCDNFEDGNFTQPLPAWTVASGSWSVAAGGSGQDLLGTLTGGGNGCIQSGTFTSCTNCTVEADVRIDTAGKRLTVVGWAQDNANYVALQLLDDQDKVSLFRLAGGSLKVNTTINTPIVSGHYYNIKITYNGQFQVLLDGAPIMTNVSPGSGAPPSGNKVSVCSTQNGLAGAATSRCADIKVYSFTDTDGDGIQDSADNCPNTANANQANADGDLLGDVCDVCPNDSTNDADGDGVCQNLDNCPGISNASQSNTDGDQFGDVCDPCPNDPSNTCGDADGDGIPDAIDNCPAVSNSNQANSDGDSFGDVCDACPNDAANDMDGDGVCGNLDNCPSVANANQADVDGDGKGDVCDACPNDGTSLFCDNFDDGNFTLPAPPWVPTAGTWSATSGDAVGTFAAGSTGALVSPSFTACTNCTVEAKVRIDTPNKRVSVFGWFIDSSNYVLVQLFDDLNRVLLYRTAAGSVKVNTTVNANIVSGQDYTVKLTYNGSFQVYLDGVQIMTNIPPGSGAAPSAGKAGFGVAQNPGAGSSTVRCSDIKVY